MRWADIEDVVEVVAVRGLLDTYRSVTGCETSLMGVYLAGGAFREGFGSSFVVLCMDAGRPRGCSTGCG